MAVVTYPDGTVIDNGNPFTPVSLATFFQALTASILGLTPAGPDDSTVWSLVRVEWPTGNQPGWKITDDVVFIACTEADDQLGRFVDRVWQTGSGDTIQQQIRYTRVWSVQWIAYGPHCFDRVRQIKDAILTSAYCYQILTAANLSVVPNVGPLLYAPELFAGAWWLRTDVSIRLYEHITEIQTLPIVRSVEIDVITEKGTVITEVNV